MSALPENTHAHVNGTMKTAVEWPLQLFLEYRETPTTPTVAAPTSATSWPVAVLLPGPRVSASTTPTPISARIMRMITAIKTGLTFLRGRCGGTIGTPGYIEG